MGFQHKYLIVRRNNHRASLVRASGCGNVEIARQAPHWALPPFFYRFRPRKTLDRRSIAGANMNPEQAEEADNAS
jgi:hypothetical protein